MGGSRKHPYPYHGRSLEIPREREVSTDKVYKGKDEAKLETFHEGIMDVFWSLTF